MTRFVRVSHERSRFVFILLLLFVTYATTHSSASSYQENKEIQDEETVLWAAQTYGETSNTFRKELEREKVSHDIVEKVVEGRVPSASHAVRHDNIVSETKTRTTKQTQTADVVDQRSDPKKRPKRRRRVALTSSPTQNRYPDRPTSSSRLEDGVKEEKGETKSSENTKTSNVTYRPSKEEQEERTRIGSAMHRVEREASKIDEDLTADPRAFDAALDDLKSVVDGQARAAAVEVDQRTLISKDATEGSSEEDTDDDGSSDTTNRSLFDPILLILVLLALIAMCAVKITNRYDLCSDPSRDGNRAVDRARHNQADWRIQDELARTRAFFAEAASALGLRERDI